MGDYEIGRGVLEIDLGVLTTNIKVARSLISAETCIMAVVKADAYGHGILEVSKAAARTGVEWFGVATADEGATLRKGGITQPILIMSPIIGPGIKGIVTNGLTATVFSLDIARKLSDAGGGRVHIKIDTGMNRIGFRVNDKKAVEVTCREILEISKMPNIVIEGIFSHFASSESDPSFTAEQFQRFEAVCRKLEDMDINIPIKHISNSGGVLCHPEYNLDMVRLGVLMYGLSPCSTIRGAEKLAKMGVLPALSLKASVGQVKSVEAGESVGYGRKYVADRPMEVVTIPLGYADGISRQLSGKGKVLINGVLCPFIGNVCMDQLMVDATGANARNGDEVTFIGKGISAEQVADWQGSINYEVATSLSLRIQRNSKYN